jgi:hypothetical protein
MENEEADLYPLLPILARKQVNQRSSGKCTDILLAASPSALTLAKPGEDWG